jgi:hypothetical protein
MAYSFNLYLIVNNISTLVNKRIPYNYLFIFSVLIIAKKSLRALSIWLFKRFFVLLII